MQDDFKCGLCQLQYMIEQQDANNKETNMLLTKDDLYSLEEYSQLRDEFKRSAVKHRRQRQVRLGEHMTLHFEDRVTVRYQVQEMLLIEKTFSPDGIQDELDAYNPLIPTGTNLKATLTIEYSDPDTRRERLQQLNGVEDLIYVEVQGHGRIYAIADEDMDRSNSEKTSAVHFLRFEFTEAQIQDIKNGHEVSVGVDHPQYNESVWLDAATKDVLSVDFAEH